MKSKKLPSVIVLMILTLLTAIFWMAFSVYRSFSKPVKVEVPEEVIQQLSPNLDINSIEAIKLRLSIQ